MLDLCVYSCVDMSQHVTHELVVVVVVVVVVMTSPSGTAYMGGQMS